MIRLLIALLLASQVVMASDDWPRGQLPDNVVPERYRLSLTIIPDEAGFRGEGQIAIRVSEPVDLVWLHGRNLAVSQVSAEWAGGSMAGSWEQLTPDGLARVSFERRLPAGPVTLKFAWSAPWGDSLIGLYRLQAGGGDYAFTQFESIYARRVFPSFDEPRFKVPFDISVTTREGYTAFSNTSVVSRDRVGNDRVRYRYALTEALPTYLIAFAVGPLEVVDADPIPPTPQRSAPLPLRGIAVAGEGPRLKFALDNTAELLVALEEYFDYPYVFDKLDLVAVPDMVASAMENQGLITYRESIMLLDETSPISRTRYWGLIHAHELGHHWFGNVVTMPWWDDIWLNEAFASWIQAKMAKLWRPDYLYELSLQSQAIGAMNADSLGSARQIRNPIRTNDDITSAFDAITYRKGAGVLRMFENYIGEEAFREGLRQHMRRFEFSLADVYDLLDSLEHVADDDKPVREPFESFLFQPGVPEITARVICDDDGNRVQLSQRRYLPLGSAESPDRQWQVPVCLALGNGPGRSESCYLLKDEAETRPLGEVCPDWVMPNARGAGYYRWLLDDEGLEALLDNNSQLDGGERLSLIDSLFAGGRSGELSARVYLEALPLLVATGDRYSVEYAADSVETLLNRLVSPGDRDAAREQLQPAFRQRYLALQSSANRNEEEQLLLTRLISLLALTFGDPELRDYLAPGGAALIAGDPASAIAPDLRITAMALALRVGGEEQTKALIGQLLASEDGGFRRDAISALALLNAPDALEPVRELLLSGDLRDTELNRWFREAFEGEAANLHWPWAQENLTAFMDTGSGVFQSRLPTYLAAGLCENAQAVRVRELFSAFGSDYRVSPRRLNQADESIRLCAAWREGIADELSTYW